LWLCGNTAWIREAERRYSGNSRTRRPLPTLLFGPLTPISFRLSGPDCLAEAADGAVEAAQAHGALTREALSPDQHEMVRALAAARGDSALAAIVAPAG